jgi:uncharacterized protein YegJ (DUF2314 family)
VPKKKAKESRYIRVSENVKQDKFIEMSKRVHAGELEWSHYAIDGNICYHFYLKKTL